MIEPVAYPGMCTGRGPVTDPGIVGQGVVGAGSGEGVPLTRYCGQGCHPGKIQKL